MRVGRLIARKTIFLDEEGLDLSRWNTFAVDLKRLIEPEPGAIYRLELSFDRPLSVYPCGNDTVVLSKEQILASDEIRFKEESACFDEEGITIIANMIGLIIIGRNGVILARTVIILIRWRERMSWLLI